MSDWSRETASLQAQACRYANRTEEDSLLQYVKDNGYVSMEKISVGSQGAYILVGEEKVLVVFQGSNGFMDFIFNFSTEHTPSSKGKVHKGFLAAWTILRRHILVALRSHKGKQIAVTGHSLGSAIAIHCTADLAEEGYSLAESYIFGCPKTGDSTWAKNVSELAPNLCRIGNNKDVITRLPVRPSYSHIDNSVILGENGVESTRRTGICTFFLDLGLSLINGFKYHSIVNYEDRVS
jgi:predicted lipase